MLGKYSGREPCAASQFLGNGWECFFFPLPHPSLQDSVGSSGPALYISKDARTTLVGCGPGAMPPTRGVTAGFPPVGGQQGSGLRSAPSVVVVCTVGVWLWRVPRWRCPPAPRPDTGPPPVPAARPLPREGRCYLGSREPGLRLDTRLPRAVADVSGPSVPVGGCPGGSAPCPATSDPCGVERNSV